MLANTVRAVCAVPVVTTFVVGALVLTAMGWWLLSVAVLGGAPDPRKRVQTMAKPKNATVDVDSLDFAQPESTRGRKSASPDACQISRYVAKNAAEGTVGVLKVKIGDTALKAMGLSLGTRSAPVKIKVEAAFADGKLYIRQCDAGGWSLSKAHNAMRAPTFGSVTFTGDLPGRVFDHTALNGSSVEVEWETSAGGSLLVLTLPSG